MESSNKINDRLNKMKDSYSKLNEILYQVNKYYDLVTEHQLIEENLYNESKNNPINIGKAHDLSLQMNFQYYDIMSLKNVFIQNVIKDNPNELILKSSLESHFSALNPFFTSINHIDYIAVFHQQNIKRRDDPDLINKQKKEEKESTINIMQLISEGLFANGDDLFTKNSHKNFTRIEGVIERIRKVNNKLEKLTKNKNTEKNQKNIDRINLEIANKEALREKLQNELEKNKSVIAKVIATIKEPSQDENSIIDINNWLNEYEKKAQYSYNLEKNNEKTTVLYNEIIELVKQSIKDDGIDTFVFIKDDEIVISSDSINTLSLKNINEKILVNIKNVYYIDEADSPNDFENKLGLLIKEFFILHDKKNKLIDSGITVDAEHQENYTQVNDSILSKINEYYHDIIEYHDLKDKITVINESLSTAKNRFFLHIEKMKIKPLINMWQEELINNKSTANIDIPKAEALTSSINGMNDQASSASDPIIQTLDKGFKLMVNSFANNFKRG